MYIIYYLQNFIIPLIPIPINNIAKINAIAHFNNDSPLIANVMKATIANIPTTISNIDAIKLKFFLV